MPPSNPRNLTNSLGDAACFGGMVGLGETYLPAFALAVGLSDMVAGLVASVPLLVGGIVQLISPWGIRWIGSLRRWVVLGAAIQAVVFVPLAIAAWQGELSLFSLMLLASIYWAAGLATGPAWNVWIEELVPASTRVRFFARRTRLQQVCTFAALLAAGFGLQVASVGGWALIGFSLLFLSSGILRAASAIFLYRHDETHGGEVAVARAEDLTDPKHIGGAKRLLTYLVLMQVFIQISGPYFVPYMLTHLSLGYGQYVCLISLAFLSKIVSLASWGRFAEQAGASKLLWFGGVGLVPLSALWIVSANFWWLALIQVLSGIAWAAYELGFFLSFFEMLPASRRARLLTIYNFANTAAICGGAIVGAGLLTYLGTNATTYAILFGVSSLGRLFCLAILAGTPLPKVPLRSITMRILSVRAGAGSVVTPVVASGEEDQRQAAG